MNKKKRIKQLQEEYENFHAVFDNMKKAVFQKENLITRRARHPLFEIEPFEALIRNEFITEDERNALFVQDTDQINPESEKLYTFTIDSETNRIVHRIRYDENNNCYETIFWYEENCHKSMQRYIHTKHPYHHGIICYTFFENGLPDLYLKCQYSKVLSKKYKIEDGRVTGYRQQHTFFSYTSDVSFEYDTFGNIEVIKEYGKDSGVPGERPEILFKRPESNQTIKSTFKRIEDFLVERISEQILKHVQIEEEVYCLMLEYAMPEAFPPELAIGVTTDHKDSYETLKSYQWYNTNLRYLYDGNTIDLYDEQMQYIYLFYYRSYDFKEYKRETFEYWNNHVRQVYVNVCRRLMDVDFSTCFNISEDYLVIARGDVYDDSEYYYKEMEDYKNNKKAL
ncbi:hypothetical protein [Flavobacterium fluviatile]|uniref:hypothetical protein n=1 Tax=Flavobacterium fluviatile TaxID=1862387 RepID=UPI0013D7687F|nr:hypothetical protein [Flavobacterium fluviatile]